MLQNGVNLDTWAGWRSSILVLKYFRSDAAFQMHRSPPARVALPHKRYVISCVGALTAFSFVFWASLHDESGKNGHWLVIVIVSYISLFSKPARKQTTHLYIVKVCTARPCNGYIGDQIKAAML